MVHPGRSGGQCRLERGVVADAAGQFDRDIEAFVHVDEQHPVLAPPEHGDQHAEAARLVALGARRVDVGQGEVPWTVMADPDGNEFCLLTPR